jgi:tRNA-dihydrouridine synthase C
VEIVGMRLLLAPMEGLADEVLRDVLTRVGGYDWAVTEFARISGTLLPPRYFRRVCMELGQGGRTTAGTPVRVQLLGSDPACLADNAARLAELGPAGIDLNFGCPAPTVNRHRGGAALLDEPELLHDIALAVRAAVPANMPVTAKMRLGIRDTARTLDCARALANGGVAQLAVHARTKAEGYRPPAHWTWIARVAEAVAIPVVANGEVWTIGDWARCRAESGLTDVMLGRGAVADPFLARRIREGRTDSAAGLDAEWAELAPLIRDFWQGVQAKVLPRHAPGRLKQWVNLLRRRYPQATELYARIRLARTMAEVDRELAVAAAWPLAA